MTKKRRAVKYDPKKSLFKRFERRLDGLWMARAWNSPELLRGGINYDLADTEMFCNYFLDRPQQWQVWLGVFQECNGEYWTNAEVITLQDMALARDLHSALTEHLIKMAQTRNHKQVIGTGWFAMPTLKFDLLGKGEEIEQMFRSRGAFNRAQLKAA